MGCKAPSLLSELSSDQGDNCSADEDDIDAAASNADVGQLVSFNSDGYDHSDKGDDAIAEDDSSFEYTAGHSTRSSDDEHSANEQEDEDSDQSEDASEYASPAPEKKSRKSEPLPAMFEPVC